MTVIQAAVLGGVQGLTEFLPVSSSAHLILARWLFGWEWESAEITFDVACHLGTLFSVLVYFQKDVVGLVAAVPGAFAGQDSVFARTGRLIFVATIPIALTGWFFVELVERLRQPAIIVVTLAGGALAMLVAERAVSHRRVVASLSVPEAAGLGCAQTLALVPGVSRSGAIITVAILLGLKREEAARFTFLVGIPAILGATARASWTLGFSGMMEHGTILLVGFVTSGLVGYLAVAGLLRYIARNSLDLFAYYRLVVSAMLGVWLLVR